MLGAKLKDLGYVGVAPNRKRWYVKSPTFSFTKITGLDAVLSPEMKSTGEAIGYDDDYQILAIEFLDSQDLWYYYDVPVEVYNDLENAESIGTYYNQSIKGVYASNKQN
jgi:hypothetical protein